MDRIEKLLAFIASDPDDFFSRHALAMEYIKLGQEKEAVQILENIITDNPEYIGSYYHLGKLLERSDPGKALTIFEKGIVVAKRLEDNHSRSELQSAIDLMD